jgi:hypothetical protein
MNDEELKTYIWLKHGPLQHTYEYLSQLPDSVLAVIINIIYSEYLRLNPDAPFHKLRQNFLYNYEDHSGPKLRYRAIVESHVEKELLKYYKENE